MRRSVILAAVLMLFYVSPVLGQSTRPSISPSPATQSAAGRLSDPEVWLCTAHPLELLEPGTNWPFVRQHLSGLQLYIDFVDKAPPDKLARLAGMLRAEAIPVSVECGGTLDFGPMDDTNGEWSARTELAKIDKFFAAGGQVDYLNLDGPVRRLLHPKRKDDKRFTSVERAVDELMDYMKAVREAHPRMQFFLLTNFPNWGYRGAVSYHARGPKRQDYGDYDDVVRVVLAKAAAAGSGFRGVTVDNPYEYLVGQRKSATLADPTRIDWLARVRAYEDFARANKLEFNLIVNSETGGQTSDAAFFEGTLKMVDAYAKAGGRPARYIVQSWYPHPRQIVPESAPHSLTALVKTVMLRLHPSLSSRDPAPRADPAAPGEAPKGSSPGHR